MMIVPIGDVKLSILHGLLKNVFPNLRAVCVDSKENLIQVYFYYDRSLSEKERALCEQAINQVKTDFLNVTQNNPLFKFEMPIIRIDYPKKTI